MFNQILCRDAVDVVNTVRALFSVEIMCKTRLYFLSNNRYVLETKNEILMDGSNPIATLSKNKYILGSAKYSELFGSRILFHNRLGEMFLKSKYHLKLALKKTCFYLISSDSTQIEEVPIKAISKFHAFSPIPPESYIHTVQLETSLDISKIEINVVNTTFYKLHFDKMNKSLDYNYDTWLKRRMYV